MQLSDNEVLDRFNRAVQDAAENEAPDSAEDQMLPEIYFAPGPKGLLITSDDLVALNAFEELLLSLIEENASAEKRYTVYYLKHENANRAASLLGEILGLEDTGGGESGGGGGLLGNLAGAALGDSGGGLMGSLLGGMSGSSSSGGSTGSISVVPNLRLNLLVIHARPMDLDLVEQLLMIIDQKRSKEEVETTPMARPIQVYNTNAEEIAENTSQLYSDRMAGTQSQPQQPRPEDIIRLMRGGGGRGSRREQEEDNKRSITLSVDTRNNRLMVAAPDPLFEQIVQVVKELDQINEANAETSQVISLKRANPILVHDALQKIIGTQSTESPLMNSSGQGGQAARKSSNGSRDGSRDRASRVNSPDNPFQFFRALQGNGKADPFGKSLKKLSKGAQKSEK